MRDFDSAPVVNPTAKDQKYHSALSGDRTPIKPKQLVPPESADPTESGDLEVDPSAQVSSGEVREVDTAEPAVAPSGSSPDEKQRSPLDLPDTSLKIAPEPIPPDRMEAYDVLVTRSKHAGHVTRVNLLREAIEIYPHGDGALANLAALLVENKKTGPEAFELASRAVRINPDNAIAWFVLGHYLKTEQEPEKSKQAYKKCAECSGPKLYVGYCGQLAR
jgi:hypothetical protein